MSILNQIDIAQLEQLRRDGAVTLLDVRTDAEVARGMLEGARHIPLHMLPGRYTELDPRGVTVVYCQSGGRSAQACTWLSEQGFERVYNLQGGTLAWARSGKALVPPTAM